METRIKDARPLLILGASVRSAAYSALRAGMRPICADLYIDEDLRAVAAVQALRNYPAELPELARRLPPGPWMYTGALENHPRIVAEISRSRPLWGNPSEVLALVRNPFWIHEQLAAAHLPTLAVRSATDPPSRDGQWMVKPFRSAAGRKIAGWKQSAANAVEFGEPFFFQKKAHGAPISALFLAAAGKTWLIGIARQFVGMRSLAAPPYAYCGSLGPIELSAEVVGQVERTGRTLAESAGLRGLFGGDFLFDSETAWLTEINPRYTASVEVFEHAYNVPLLEWHRRACLSYLTADCRERDLQIDVEPLQKRKPAGIVGKIILYAKHDVTTVTPPDLCRPTDVWSIPLAADIPAAGSAIRAGHPVCTVLAADSNESGCLHQLANRVRQISHRVIGRAMELGSEIFDDILEQP